MAAMNVQQLARSSGFVVGALSLLSLLGCEGRDHYSGTSTGATDTLAVSPTVSVDAVVNGGRQTVSLSFNATDSSTLTDLTVTAGLSSLPPGWSGPSSFTCATVSTGSGCLLNLAYAPTVVGAGVLQIHYSYTDSAGAPQTGMLTVNYAGTTKNNIVATVSPAGQIVATVAQGSQKATVTFTTDDGNSASAFTLTTDLGTLPAGWKTSASSLTCGSVSTGNGCQLPLTYTPTAPASGTLSLNYSYKDNSAEAKTGTVVIRYSATTNDNIVGTVAPTGQIGGPIGNAAQAVAVTFTTDDGFPATDLSVTSGLSSLPVGWSSSVNTLTCAHISTGAGCRVNLSFIPTATATGTLSLGYAYTNNAGTAKTGTVNIAYLSTSHNTVLGTPIPAGTVRVKVGANKQIQLVFTTNDGNTATHFKVTSDLTALPAGWSGTNGFACAAVNSGTGCSLPLRYAPVTNATGTLTLNVSYTDSAFTAQTGSVSVQYSNPHVYTLGPITDLCSIIANGTLNTCAQTATSADTTSTTGGSSYGPGTFSGGYGYIPGANSDFDTCTLESDGTLDDCVSTSLESGEVVYAIASYANYVYIDYYDDIQVCTIGTAGSLVNCVVTASTSGISDPYGIAANARYAYIVDYALPSMCIVSPTDGTLNDCSAVTITANNAALNGTAQVKIYGNYVYAPDGGAGVVTCAIASDGSLPNCTTYSTGSYAADIAILDTDAYVSSGSDIYHCTVDQATGALSACALSDGTPASNNIGGVIVQ
jgi:hypothetical protein